MQRGHISALIFLERSSPLSLSSWATPFCTPGTTTPPILWSTQPALVPSFLALHGPHCKITTSYFLLSLKRQRLPLSSDIPFLPHPWFTAGFATHPRNEQNHLIIGSFLYQASSLWWGYLERSTRPRRLHEKAFWHEKIWTPALNDTLGNSLTPQTTLYSRWYYYHPTLCRRTMNTG